MNSTTAPNPTPTALAGCTVGSGNAPPQDLPPAARAVARLLQGLQHGSLTVQWPQGQLQHFGVPGGAAQADALHAVMHVHNHRVCAAVLKSGDIGFAEAYIAGDWTTPHLPELLRLLAANRQALDDVIYGSWWGRLAYRVRHWLHRNTKTNSRKNIHAHYDLGNAFYQAWLDGTMNYSSAWFEGQRDGNLEAAQHAKVRRALSMAGVRPGHRVLEIGCGWGALAEKATVDYGAQVVGVTLSTEQLAYAQQRMRRLGVADQADLRLQDYRDVQEMGFDAVCSIEMVEAVGRSYWPTYFQAVDRALKFGGRACIQSIVIKDELFDRYVQSTDFIQQYIFPGGCLPSRREFRREVEKTNLRVVDELAFGLDYAETCRRWRESFLAQRPQVHQQGFDERFVRIWEFYLAYCEAGFEAGDIDVVQFTLVKP
jgi:cyclopropane-fatty-acyl-phospholipid synthase